MKLTKKLGVVLREILRFAKWLLKHYDEFAPLIDIARRLVDTAEGEGGTADEKFERVRDGAMKTQAGRSVKASSLNLAIERAVCELNDETAKGKGGR